MVLLKHLAIELIDIKSANYCKIILNIVFRCELLVFHLCELACACVRYVALAYHVMRCGICMSTE